MVRVDSKNGEGGFRSLPPATVLFGHPGQHILPSEIHPFAAELILMKVHARSNVAVATSFRSATEAFWPKRRAWISDHSVNRPSIMTSKSIRYLS